MAVRSLIHEQHGLVAFDVRLSPRSSLRDIRDGFIHLTAIADEQPDDEHHEHDFQEGEAGAMEERSVSWGRGSYGVIHVLPLGLELQFERPHGDRPRLARAARSSILFNPARSAEPGMAFWHRSQPA